MLFTKKGTTRLIGPKSFLCLLGKKKGLIICFFVVGSLYYSYWDNPFNIIY